MPTETVKTKQLEKIAKQKAHSASKVNHEVNRNKGPRPIGQVVQQCPDGPALVPKKAPNTSVVCDIATLTLHDETSKKNLRCSSHDESPVPRNVPRHVASLLGHYDLIMELVSDYEKAGSLDDVGPDQKFVKLDIGRTGRGSCPNREHPSVKMTTSDSADSKYEHDWKTQKPEVLQIPARPISIGDSMAAWLIPFWTFGKGTMDLIVIADGCGVGVESPVNYKFKALVRIYPNDKYELILKLPPFKKWEKEKERAHWGDKQMASGSSSSSSFGKKTSEDKYERRKDGDAAATWSYTKGKTSGNHYDETEVSYKKGGQWSRETSRTDYSAGGLISSTSKGEDELHPKLGTGLSLDVKHNGTSLKVVKKLTGIVKSAFSIAKTIEKIKELLDTVPKVGLTFKFDFSILEGSLKGTWGTRIMDGANGSGPRYVAVESYFEIDVGLKLFDLSLELGFGFQLIIPAIVDWFDDPTLELILKAAIKATVEAAIKYKALSSTKDNHKVKIESEPKLTVYVEFKVMAMGKGLDADGGIRGGLKCEGSFHVSFSHAPDFELEAGSKPIEVYARYFVDLVIYDKSDHWEHELVPEHEFYKGPIPHKDAAEGEAAGAAAE